LKPRWWTGSGVENLIESAETLPHKRVRRWSGVEAVETAWVRQMLLNKTRARNGLVGSVDPGKGMATMAAEMVWHPRHHQCNRSSGGMWFVVEAGDERDHEKQDFLSSFEVRRTRDRVDCG